MKPNHEPRELTPGERKRIRRLVTALCANHCDLYGCLPLDCDCVMLDKRWTGGGCRYFRESVLPSDLELNASLSNRSPRTRYCSGCGKPFLSRGRKAYCSAGCAGNAKRVQQREHMRRKRGMHVEK
jgi:hypothetical protein